jgi:hypothetical protein
MSTVEPQTVEPQKKKRGCLFWIVVGFVVLVVGGYGAYRYGKHRFITAYTDTAPLELGAPDITPQQLGELHGKLAAFGHALRNKTPVDPLVLSSAELTALVSGSPDFERLGGRAKLEVKDGEIGGDLSVPLERLGYPDRWFNGSALFAVTLDNGVLIVTVRSASVRGQPVPDWMIERLGQQNLAKNLYERPDVAALIGRLESIELKDGKVTIVPRIRTGAATGAEPPL